MSCKLSAARRQKQKFEAKLKKIEKLLELAKKESKGTIEVKKEAS